MEISTSYLTNYLFELGYNWELFEGLSSMAQKKKEQLIADWRFGETMDSENVKKVFKAFKKNQYGHTCCRTLL